LRALGTYFLLVQKVGKDTLKGGPPIRLGPRAGHAQRPGPLKNSRFYGRARFEGLEEALPAPAAFEFSPIGDAQPLPFLKHSPLVYATNRA